PGPGRAPGRRVMIRYRPPASVGHRPKPRNPEPAPAPGRPAAPGPRGSSGGAKLPSGAACQVSISASGTGSPAPSSTTPLMVIAPGVPSGTTNGPSGQGSPIARNGPIVCDGVSGRLTGPPPPARTRPPRGRAARCPTDSPEPTPAPHT